MLMTMTAPDVQHHFGTEQKPGPCEPWRLDSQLGDNTTTAVTTAEARTVAAGAARAAAAVVGNVITTPYRWQASISQSRWTLPTAIGVAG